MDSLIIIEPFFGGSHAELAHLIYREFEYNIKHTDIYTLPAKKWHWRARTSALFFSRNVIAHYKLDTKEGYGESFKGVLFVSSVLNLAELIGLRPDLAKMHKIIYFHENDLVYPVRKKQDRDFQYGYNQVLSCLVADRVVFNSEYNKSSFLSNIKTFFKLMPDFRPKYVREDIEPKCQVIYFPVDFDSIPKSVKKSDENNKEQLHIVWPHRWEHDKNPELFFQVLFSLKEQGMSFIVSVLGETFSQIPRDLPISIFNEAKEKLSENISNWGFVESKYKYYDILSTCDVVVSTANHEFFGVAMLEAVHQGCYPLCPNALVYPEIYPASYLYNTPAQLEKQLKRFCINPSLARSHTCEIDLKKYSWSAIKWDYRKLFSSFS
uniref:tRNA-queuosine alpha-mannosyltransferase n=1 Tax=Strigamia maritima TaxID=126957 RepID=T1J8J5_STRMM